MSEDFYTVIMISTIHSMYGQFSPEERFQQTLKSLESVKKHIPNCKILFVDNSNSPISTDWQLEINRYADVFYQIPHNLFSLYANLHVTRKSESEANMMYMALEKLKETNMIGKRIFKISGRYKIADTFDIKEYENPAMDGKYTFVPTQIASTEDNWFTSKKIMWFEQALISFNKEHVDGLLRQLFGMLAHMRRTGDCIEETMYYYIPHEQVFAIQKAHIEGFKAEGGKVSH
jgi:hypothetical protein